MVAPSETVAIPPARCVLSQRPMSPPREILPGTTYLVTRRCSQRQFLLRPSPTTSQVFLFLLAVAAHRYGIDVHAFCVLSNHYHLVVTDPHARLPAFQQLLDALLARALNAISGRTETFWAPDSYSAVKLTTPADVLDKIAYVLANPVAAGLVGTGSAWPGPWSGPDRIGGDALEARRPGAFFDPAGTLPAVVSLRLTVPCGFSSPERFRSDLASAVAEREDRARSLWHARGGFLGVNRVLAQKPTQHPSRLERRSELNPRVAARDKWKRIEALGRLLEFLRAYRSAWNDRQAGKPGVVFPAGTYLMRVRHGVACAATG